MVHILGGCASCGDIIACGDKDHIDSKWMYDEEYMSMLCREHAHYYKENKQIDKITYYGFLNHKVFNESAQNTFFFLFSSEVPCLLNL